MAFGRFLTRFELLPQNISMANVMKFAAAYENAERILKQEWASYIEGEHSIVRGHLVLTTRGVRFEKHTRLFGIFGVLGELLAVWLLPRKLMFDIPLESIVTIAQSKFGRNENVLACATRDQGELRFLISDYKAWQSAIAVAMQRLSLKPDPKPTSTIARSVEVAPEVAGASTPGAEPTGRPKKAKWKKELAAFLLPFLVFAGIAAYQRMTTNGLSPTFSRPLASKRCTLEIMFLYGWPQRPPIDVRDLGWKRTFLGYTFEYQVSQEGRIRGYYKCSTFVGVVTSVERVRPAFLGN